MLLSFVYNPSVEEYLIPSLLTVAKLSLPSTFLKIPNEN